MSFFDIVITPARHSKTSESKASLRGGVNRRDNPIRIGAEQAIKIENYLVEADGIAVVREGLTEKEKIDQVYTLTGISGTYTKGETVTGTNTATVVAFFSPYLYVKDPTGDLSGTITGGTSGATGTFSAVAKLLTPSPAVALGTDYLMIAFDDATRTHFGKYQISTDTVTIFKTFATTTKTRGVEYAKYCYAVNQAEEVGMFYPSGKFLNYDNESGTPAVGELVTAASGGTGTIVAFVDSGTSGTLLLDNVTGTIANNDALTGSVAFAADADATPYDWYTITGAPKAKYITVYERAGRGAHLVTANLESNAGLIHGSREYTNSDITTFPFGVGKWTIAGVGVPDDGDAFITPFSGGGDIQNIVADNNLMFVQSEKATGFFHIERIDVSDVGSSQIIITDSAKRNFGGYNAIFTQYGILAASERGIFQVNFVQGDEQNADVTNILGEEDIAESNFSNTQFVYDGKNRVYAFFRKGSTRNNRGLAINYSAEGRILTDITGMSINGADRIGTELYGVSSAGFKIYNLFDGYDDDGRDIETRILFGHNDAGSPIMVKQANDFTTQFLVSNVTVIKVAIHIFDEYNVFRENKAEYYLLGAGVNPEVFGLDVTSFNDLIESGKLVQGEGLYHFKVTMPRFLKYQVEITSSDQARHEFHYWNMDTENLYKVKLKNAYKRTQETFYTNINGYYLTYNDSYLIRA